jgi:hypothetical protein
MLRLGSRAVVSAVPENRSHRGERDLAGGLKSGAEPNYDRLFHPGS